MEYDRLIELIDKIEDNNATHMEMEELESFYQSFEHNKGITSGLKNEEVYKTDLLARILTAIQMMRAVQKTKPTKLWFRFIGVAAAIAFVVSGIYFFEYNNRQTHETQIENIASIIKPGKVGATLTLADGKKIRLSDAANGELVKQAGVVVSKSANGQLVYEIQKDEKENIHQTNTLSTAKGETYQVRLPDGSLVWLNAASSLTYPAGLKERGLRRVKLEGEGYFEIAKDKDHPFIVATDNQEIRVLGTHFNVNSYKDEPDTKTTLLEGSVQINGKTIIKPDEMASTDGQNKKTKITEVNAEKYIAWKNGKFVFEEEDIESVMRKLSRWYNVEIIYQGDFSNRTFVGSISRYDNISKILDKITFTQAVHFKIEGRRIYVMP